MHVQRLNFKTHTIGLYATKCFCAMIMIYTYIYCKSTILIMCPTVNHTYSTICVRAWLIMSQCLVRKLCNAVSQVTSPPLPKSRNLSRHGRRVSKAFHFFCLLNIYLHFWIKLIFEAFARMSYIVSIIVLKRIQFFKNNFGCWHWF